ncbi:sensor histidine kinase [Kitasatospora sp. NA04385]|uniref:sensor histidine kinase n=1 Tax=Kitasatospora sp. NA04385 TaxID=2742135 RepID=UPI0015917B7A|nr:sensor histidine kinase [Kitasatospora sp. NA04385]QKW22693.1 sensor histidine kinase [Kitasatospora sp. NA04385]
MPPNTARLRLPALPKVSGRVPAPLADAAPAVVLFVAMLVERFGAAARIGDRMPYALALTVALALPVAARRRAPLTAFLVGTLALTAEAQLVAPSPVSPYANLFGAYAVGRYAGRGRAGWGPPLVVLGIVGYFAGQDVEAVTPVGFLALWLAVWAYGYADARRLAEQAVERRRARAELLAEERTRIAREVHDLVGHSLNLMLVQAGAARRLIDRTPERSRELLVEIERTGNDALGELDRVLGLLRGAAPRHPDGAPPAEPGVAELPYLVERMSRAGLAVALHRDAPPLPPEQDRCAYRVVQESLTNALRHSGAAYATVRIVRQEERTLVEVLDDGSGPPPGHRPGRGLTGIAERAARLNGTAQHGLGPNGGFLVRVSLPTGGGA